ncbi:MAG: tetratricopeptide repeat protein [Betaproteobacteria bacterium]|nr:tetratricopeptide repeat protein [Betaproteobacteria bacterium]
MNSSELNASVDVLADQAVRTARAGDLRAGLGLARHAVSLGRVKDEPAHLYALNALGLVQGACGLFIEAIASCIDAYAMALRLQDARAALHAAVTAAGAGTFILEAGEVTESLLKRCTEASMRLNDTPLLVRIDNTYGIYYLNVKRFDEGIAAYNRALEQVGEPDTRAWLFTPRYMIMGNLAFLHVQRALAAPPETHAAMVASARERIALSVYTAHTFQNVDAEARAQYGQGVLQAHLGEYSDALVSFERALAIARRIQHQPRLVDTLIEMGKCWREMKEYTQAIAALDDAHATADGIRPTMKLPRICDDLAATYEALGRMREGAHYRAMAARERELLGRENAHAMRDLTTFSDRLQIPGME